MSGDSGGQSSRIITGLLLQELDEAAWDKAMYKENVLQKRTQSTVRRISSALRKRLEHLSSDFWAFAFLC
ncbi:BrxA family protein [Escherichia coli]